MKIGTHNGVFHADDVFAVAALRLLGGTSPFSLVRTRDEALLSECDVLVDVGGVCDPAHGRFDHHMRGGAGARENGVPYSSFGLVWKHYGHDCCGSMAVVAEVDRRLVQGIDAVDNGYALYTGGTQAAEGISPQSLSAAISGFNPTWQQANASFDEAFATAVTFAGAVLANAIAAARAVLAAEKEVLAAVTGATVVVLERYVPWDAAIQSAAAAHALFVAFPSETGDWRVQCIAPKPGSFEKRKPLPAAWAGLRAEALAELTGVSDAVFCHPGLFICGAQSRAGALELARQACLA